MSRERFILNNKLRGIDNNLDNLNDNLQNLHFKLGNINSEIGSIGDKQEVLDDRMNSLSTSLQDFIETDAKNNQLQLAETRQGNLNQDLHNKFGYYAEIRRMVLGILQAVDSGIVSHETLQNATETLMIKTPDYWIAPALVAIVAWIRDDKEDTEKALKEALRRDDYKTTLFFMLIMRRLGRNDACHQWMQRYLMHQDPNNLNREFVTVLEAAATGLFPPVSRQLMLSTVNKWVIQLTQSDQYINEQKNEWLKFFQDKGDLSSKQYPLLQKHCTNWAELTASMKKARLHQFLNNYFKNILNSNIDESKSSKDQLDEILSLLISNFDDEELELKEKVRQNQHIIDQKGDIKSSSQNNKVEKKTNFLRLLTSSALNPELAGVSKSTQALAIAISQPWIIEAHDSYTAEYRMNYITNAELDINGFCTSTSDGSDETEQLKSHNEHWGWILSGEMKKNGIPGCAIAISVFFYVIATLIYIYRPKFHTTSYVIFTISTLFLGVIYWGGSINKSNAKKKNNDARAKSQEVLRGCLAELADFRAEYNMEDTKAEEIRSMLQSISVEEFLGNSRDTKAML